MPDAPVVQLRLVIEADDFAAAVAFYRDVLGLPEQAAFEGDGDARVVILEAGRATLEIADTRGTVERLTAAGATLLGGPVETPWRSLNARLAGPAGVQLTIFEELESLEERTRGEHFGTAVERDR